MAAVSVLGIVSAGRETATTAEAIKAAVTSKVRIISRVAEVTMRAEITTRAVIITRAIITITDNRLAKPRCLRATGALAIRVGVAKARHIPRR